MPPRVAGGQSARGVGRGAHGAPRGLNGDAPAHDCEGFDARAEGGEHRGRVGPHLDREELGEPDEPREERKKLQNLVQRPHTRHSDRKLEVQVDLRTIDRRFERRGAFEQERIEREGSRACSREVEARLNR